MSSLGSVFGNTNGKKKGKKENSKKIFSLTSAISNFGPREAQQEQYLTFQDGPGIAVSDARAKRALSRLAVCLETLYAGGMHRARRWVVPICRK